MAFAVVTIGLVVAELAWAVGADALAARRCLAGPSSEGPAESAPRLFGDPEPWPGVLSTETADVSPRFEGRIAKILVRAGDVVKDGQVLAELDSSLQRHELVAAEALVRASQAEVWSAGVAATAAGDRQKRRGGAVSVAGADLSLVSKEEQATARFDWMAAASRAGAASANAAERRARLEQLREAVAESVMRAPFDGVVAARYADPGAYARIGAPLVRLVGRAGFRVRFAVPEAEMKTLKKGARVTVAWEGHTLGAEVDRIAPEIESATSTLFVEAAITESPSMDGTPALTGRVVAVRAATERPKG